MDFFTSACSDYFSCDLVSVSPLPVSILGCYTFQPGSLALGVQSLEPWQAAQSSALRLSVLQHQDSYKSIQSKAFCSRLIHTTVAAWQLGCLCPSLHPQTRNLVDVWRYFLLAVGSYWQFWVAAMSEKKNWFKFWECGLIFFIYMNHEGCELQIEQVRITCKLTQHCSLTVLADWLLWIVHMWSCGSLFVPLWSLLINRDWLEHQPHTMHDC